MKIDTGKLKQLELKYNVFFFIKRNGFLITKDWKEYNWKKLDKEEIEKDNNKCYVSDVGLSNLSNSEIEVLVKFLIAKWG